MFSRQGGLCNTPQTDQHGTIHTSGIGILTVEDLDTRTCGLRREKMYNGWDGVNELINMRDQVFHRNLDKIALAPGVESPHTVKTAIVCPPAIYGPGRGTGNKRSTQLYVLASTVLERGKAIKVGEGKYIWHTVHIYDLSEVYLELVEGEVAGDGVAA